LAGTPGANLGALQESINNNNLRKGELRRQVLDKSVGPAAKAQAESELRRNLDCAASIS